MTIKEFAETIIDITKSKSSLTYSELPIDDPKVRQPDISLAIKLLDWKPKVKFRDGLVETIKYFRKKLGIVE